MQTHETWPREGPKGQPPPPGQEPKELAGETPRSPSEAVLESGLVDSRKELGGGMNWTEILVIKDDGNGVWKPKEGERQVAERGTGYRRERAAYLVDLFLDFDFVPPTVIREIEGEVGSLQEYIPEHQVGSAFPYNELCDRIAHQPQFKEQLMKLRLFDYIIANTDRHSGNWLLDKTGKLWAIDHGHTFREYSSHLFDVADFTFSPETIRKISDLAESSSKRALLKTLLEELLPLDEADAVIKRLRWLADALGSGTFTGDGISSLVNKARQDAIIRIKLRDQMV